MYDEINIVRGVIKFSFGKITHNGFDASFFSAFSRPWVRVAGETPDDIVRCQLIGKSAADLSSQSCEQYFLGLVLPSLFPLVTLSSLLSPTGTQIPLMEPTHPYL